MLLFSTDWTEKAGAPKRCTSGPRQVRRILGGTVPGLCFFSAAELQYAKDYRLAALKKRKARALFPKIRITGADSVYYPWRSAALVLRCLING